MLQARVYGMIENIGGGYLILDPRNQGHENG